MTDEVQVEQPRSLDPTSAGPRVSARAVVFNEQREVLLIRHRDGDSEFYVLPGGRVEGGETAAEAVVREVLEETGCTVRVGELLWVREYLPGRHLGNPHHTTKLQQLQIYFEAELEPGAAVVPASMPDGTQAATVWHPVHALKDLRLRPVGLAAPIAAVSRGERSPVYLGDLL